LLLGISFSSPHIPRAMPRATRQQPEAMADSSDDDEAPEEVSLGAVRGPLVPHTARRRPRPAVHPNSPPPIGAAVAAAAADACVLTPSRACHSYSP